jgi:hypothetical protein
MKSLLLVLPLVAAGGGVLLLSGCTDSTTPTPQAGSRPPQRMNGRESPGPLPRGPGVLPPYSPAALPPSGGTARHSPPFFSALDTNDDGSLSTLEIDEAPAFLSKMDRNNDGIVTGMEFGDAVRSYAPESSPESRMHTAQSSGPHGGHSVEGFPPRGPRGQGMAASGPRGQGRRDRAFRGRRPANAGELPLQGPPNGRPSRPIAEAPIDSPPVRSEPRAGEPATGTNATLANKSDSTTESDSTTQDETDGKPESSDLR